ncbi:hypothetical protein H0264_22960 [Nocardia huaxiensis]|uniref:Uncharacterized protein n=1 Tax=Nocardia huaxiensis TaxID=2755382 RepID=A0A7D6ZEF7_9NOCA|nr:hypothetical protein [Nocardia huaxiensis]QLY28247.1 hypothetical protein H0264_22960 [Nocardia huaxiensis]
MKLKHVLFTFLAAGCASIVTATPATAAPAPVLTPVAEECYPYSLFASLSGGPAKCFSRAEFWQNTIQSLGTLSAGGSSGS